MNSTKPKATIAGRCGGGIWRTLRRCCSTVQTDRRATSGAKPILASRFRYAMMATMTIEQLKGVVHSDREIMGGTPVFVGTRVPLQHLIEDHECRESIEECPDSVAS